MITVDDFDAAIFDLDGTIADSNRVWEKIDRRYMQSKGKFLSDRELKRMAAMTYEECAEFIASKGIEVSVPELRKEFNKMAVYEYRNSIFPKPGAPEFLKFLKAKGKFIALATASPRELYEPFLCHNCIYSYFDCFVTTEEAGKSKDHPDVYLLAASKLGVSPDCCAVFEDLLAGIVSARDAGMYTVGVYDKYSEEDIISIRNTADRFIMDFSEMMIK